MKYKNLCWSQSCNFGINQMYALDPGESEVTRTSAQSSLSPMFISQAKPSGGKQMLLPHFWHHNNKMYTSMLGIFSSCSNCISSCGRTYCLGLRSSSFKGVFSVFFCLSPIQSVCVKKSPKVSSLPGAIHQSP